MSDSELYEDDQLFEKPRGNYQSKHKFHHRGKQRCYDKVKDRGFVEKVVEDQSKQGERQPTTSDDLQNNVMYSINKKNRFRDVDPVELLKNVPEGVNAEVVEKNAVFEFGFWYPNHTTFAVHTKKPTSDSKNELGFEIDSASSSGLIGQDRSNFLAENRQSVKQSTSQEKIDNQSKNPTVSYNIYKTHPSAKGVGNYMFQPSKVSKTSFHRKNKNVDKDQECYLYYMCIEDSVDREFLSDDEEPEKEERLMNLGDLQITEKPSQSRERKARKNANSECDSQFEIVDLPVQTNDQKFPSLLDLSKVLSNEGYYFSQFSGVLGKQEAISFEDEIDLIQADERFKVKPLRENQYFIDCTKYHSILNQERAPIKETTLVIVLTEMENKELNFVINSTIPGNVSKHDSQFWTDLIKNSTSIWTAVRNIATEFSKNSQILEIMKLSSSFFKDKTFAEMFHDPENWSNHLPKSTLPNRFDHESWANSLELCLIGVAVEWSEITKTAEPNFYYSRSELKKCGTCSRERNCAELFVIDNEHRNVECSECLREKFYNSLRARNSPINLMISKYFDYELYSSIIPLTILNLYIRMATEEIYKMSGYIGIFEKCPKCKTFLFFEKDIDKNPSFSCSCGYTWCHKCREAPHWPMTCEMFAEWKKRWDIRYAITKAQGSGFHKMLQVTCRCKQSIIYVLNLTEFMKCPECGASVHVSQMREDYHPSNYPWPTRTRKRFYTGEWNMDEFVSHHPYSPFKSVLIDISRTPMIKTWVSEICGNARDARYDDNLQNLLIKAEKNLVGSGFPGAKGMRELFSTTFHIAENVPGWMTETGTFDKKLKKKLEDLMSMQQMLIENLNVPGSIKTVELIEKLKAEKDSIIDFVNDKLMVRRGD